MKKHLLIAIFIFSSFFIYNPKTVYAQEKCTSAGLCMVAGSNCKSAGFDCNNSFTVNSKGDCENQGGCFESVTCTGQWVSTMYCYLPKNVPQKTNQPFLQGDSHTEDKIFCDSDDKQTNYPDPNNPRIYTAIGCIPVTGTSEFVAWILRWAIGIGGGIALLLIIVASFQIITSSGNPEKVQAGKELLTSAIAGLIMLIFSVFILKIIGVDILKLPGLK